MPHWGEMEGKSLEGRRTETYSGTTDSNGDFIVNFPRAFSGNPHIDVALPGADAQTSYRLVSISPTAVTIRVERRSSLTVLSLQVLSFAVAAVAGQSISVMVAQRD